MTRKLLVLVFLAFPGTGCVEDDSGTPTECESCNGPTGSAAISWRLFSETAPTTTCEARGVATILVSARAAGGETTEQAFDCVDGNGELVLPIGTFDVWATALDADERIAALSSVTPLTISPQPSALDFAMDVSSAKFSLEWRVTKSGAEATCDAIAADEIIFTAAWQRTHTFVERFPCSTYAATTKPLPLGKYTLSFQLGGLPTPTLLPLEKELTSDGDIIKLAPVQLGR